MKYLRPFALTICLFLAFMLGTLWRSHDAKAATASTLGMTCTAGPPSTGASAHIVCVGDLDGTGTGKILLATMESNGVNGGNVYWKLSVKTVSSVQAFSPGETLEW
jgi:hypothetical protein